MNTTYFLNCSAGNLFGTKTTPAIPTAYYIGLSTSAPDVSGSGANEPSTDAGYARVELTHKLLTSMRALLAGARLPIL